MVASRAQVCNGGIASLVPGQESVIFLGSGDGKIKGIVGDDVVWEVISDATLEFAQAAITSPRARDAGKQSSSKPQPT